MTIYTLAERNGKLYAREEITDPSLPRTIVNYWATVWSYAEFATWFATPELAQAALGCELSPMNNRPVTALRDVRGFIYRVPQSGRLAPAFTEIELIPEPTQRGRALPLRWKNGAWEKQTARAGWVRA